MSDNETTDLIIKMATVDSLLATDDGSMRTFVRDKGPEFLKEIEEVERLLANIAERVQRAKERLTYAATG